MKPVLTPQQISAFKKIGANCRDCLPLLEFLEKLGVECQELRKRWEHQVQVADMALELAGALKSEK